MTLLSNASGGRWLQLHTWQALQ